MMDQRLIILAQGTRNPARQHHKCGDAELIMWPSGAWRFTQGGCPGLFSWNESSVLFGRPLAELVQVRTETAQGRFSWAGCACRPIRT
jgi:hypothetical protein